MMKILVNLDKIQKKKRNVEFKKNMVNSIIYINNSLKNMQMNKVLTVIVSFVNFASNQKILNKKCTLSTHSYCPFGLLCSLLNLGKRFHRIDQSFFAK